MTAEAPGGACAQNKRTPEGGELNRPILCGQYKKETLVGKIEL